MTGLTNILIPNTTVGLGAINNIGSEVERLGASKILIITDKVLVKTGIIDRVKTLMKDTKLPTDIYEDCKPEPPISIIEAISAMVKENGYDLLIGIGGGSNMDSTKVASAFANSNISLSEYLKNHRGEKVEGKTVPKMLIPTTAGTGAEWSLAAVVYDSHGHGHPFGIEQHLADKVIIDPELTLNLPQNITAETGFDALTHAVEAYTCSTANFFSDMLAATAIKLIGENILPAYAKGHKNIEARYNMSFAAALAMNSAITSGMGMCHIISELVQAKAHVSHGASLAIMLPAVMEYNLIGNPRKFAKIADLLGENVSGLSVADAGAKAVSAVRRLINDLRLPRTMSEVGIKEADIAPMSKQCYATAMTGINMWNPRDASEDDITQIYTSAL